MSEVTTGVVKWFNERQGFGFITCSAVNKDVFIHYKELRGQKGFAVLLEGDTVTFLLVKTPRGWAAENCVRKTNVNGRAYKQHVARRIPHHVYVFDNVIECYDSGGEPINRLCFFDLNTTEWVHTALAMGFDLSHVEYMQ